MTSIGVDIEEVARFKQLIKNKKFLDRVYTPKEISYCRSKKNAIQHFAVRFAAKEAVWKALSDKKLNLSHKDIGVHNAPTGKPSVIFPGRFAALSKKVSLSLSHTRSAVVAVALVR